MPIVRNSILACFASLVLLVTTQAVASDTPEAIKLRIGKGDPVTGSMTSQLCQGCHGETGKSVEDLIPRLAGQYSVYIAKQFRNYQTGARKHQIMSAMSQIMSEAELLDIAAYFASQQQMSGGGKSGNAIGKKLFTKGDVARDIPACVGCHGVNGKGQAPDVFDFPVIGGQNQSYLKAQLQNWRSGARSNSAGGVMNQVAKSLTDGEIQALSEYLSGL